MGIEIIGGSRPEYVVPDREQLLDSSLIEGTVNLEYFDLTLEIAKSELAPLLHTLDLPVENEAKWPASFVIERCETALQREDLSERQEDIISRLKLLALEELSLTSAANGGNTESNGIALATVECPELTAAMKLLLSGHQLPVSD